MHTMSEYSGTEISFDQNTVESQGFGAVMPWGRDVPWPIS